MKKISFLFLFLFLLACTGSDKPEGILDKQTYKQILKEIILVDVVSNHKKLKDSFDFNLLQLVYNKYHVDSLILKKNADYYARHPEVLKEIYQEIKDTYKQQLDSVIKLDSIRRKSHKSAPVKPQKQSITVPNNILGLKK